MGSLQNRILLNCKLLAGVAAPSAGVCKPARKVRKWEILVEADGELLIRKLRILIAPEQCDLGTQTLKVVRLRDFYSPCYCQIVKWRQGHTLTWWKTHTAAVCDFFAPLPLIEPIFAQGLLQCHQSNSFQPPVQQLAGNVYPVMSKLKASHIC